MGALNIKMQQTSINKITVLIVISIINRSNSSRRVACLKKACLFITIRAVLAFLFMKWSVGYHVVGIG